MDGGVGLGVKRAGSRDCKTAERGGGGAPPLPQTTARGTGGGGLGSEASEGGEGGSGTQKCVYQKWPDFPNGGFRFFSRWSLWFGAGGGGGLPPPVVYGHSNPFLGLGLLPALCTDLQQHLGLYLQGPHSLMGYLDYFPRIPKAFWKSLALGQLEEYGAEYGPDLFNILAIVGGEGGGGVTDHG